MNLCIIDSLDSFKTLIHSVNGSLYELIFESSIHSIRSKLGFIQKLLTETHNSSAVVLQVIFLLAQLSKNIHIVLKI